MNVGATVLEYLRKEKPARARLQGKVGIITGVGLPGGIGTLAAQLFAREGVQALYLLDVSTGVESVAKELGAAIPECKVTAVVGDAGSPETVKALVDRVMAEHARLDFFWSNAGISQKPPAGAPLYKDPQSRMFRPTAAIEADEFMEVIRVNTLSAFLAIKYAGQAMQVAHPDKAVPGGSIILTASVAGLKANGGPLPYSASKAAVISLAQTASYELYGTNVRVNAICPGLIETEMTKPIFAVAAMNKVEPGATVPVVRQGLPIEIANTALWLASDDALFMNGSAVTMDGGLTASIPFVARA